MQVLVHILFGGEIGDDGVAVSLDHLGLLGRQGFCFCLVLVSVLVGPVQAAGRGTRTRFELVQALW